MAAIAWLMSFRSCIVRIWFVYRTFLWGHWKVRYTNQIRTRFRNWRTSATQLQPSKSLCYIGYTSTWLDVRSCVVMQEATTFSIFYDGISFQHLATVLISVFTLCYGPGLLIRDPPCTKLRKLDINWCENKIKNQKGKMKVWCLFSCIIKYAFSTSRHITRQQSLNELKRTRKDEVPSVLILS